MVKITADLIQQSPQFTNPVRDREIDLRGYKVTVIENLGATLDQFDCIDLSDNDIKKVEGFPLLKRLKMLLINNNRVCRFEEHLEASLPNIENITAINNNVQELVDLDPLSTIKSLTHVSFIRNPVANKPHYRSYLIFKAPQLRVIDFQKIKMKERQIAKKIFTGKKGESLRKDILAKRNKTFEVKDVTVTTVQEEQLLALKYKDQEAIKEAISKANTLEEVRKLELLLQQGHIPGKTVNGTPKDQTEEVEMDE